MFQSEHNANVFQLEHSGDLQLYVQTFRRKLYALDVPVGTFGKDQKRSA
jgi:hypothetical protein